MSKSQKKIINYYTMGISNSNLYALLFYFEKIMKEFIFSCGEQYLSLNNGDGWKKVFYEKIDKELNSKVESNRQVTLSKNFYWSGEYKVYDDIDLLEFSFIKKACISWWDLIFKNYFIERLQFEAQMDKLTAIRNSVAHCREVSDEDQKEIAKIIFIFIKIIQKKYLPPHFERLEVIKDRYDLGLNNLREVYDQLKFVYKSRSLMKDKWPLTKVVEDAKTIEVIGISINELTIKFERGSLVNAIKKGTEITLLFLDPFSKNTSLREVEEILPRNQIKDMTIINMKYIEKIINEIGENNKLSVYTYNEIPRFNLMFIDKRHLFVQYYAYYTRGEDNPCFYIENDGDEGIYTFYYNIYLEILKRSREFKGFKNNNLFKRGKLM